MAVPSVEASLQDTSRFLEVRVLSGFASHAIRTLSWIVFTTVLVLIAVLPFPYGAVQAWWTALFEVIVFVATILWIIHGLLSGSWFVKEHKVLIPLLAVVLFAFAQTIPLSSVPSTIRGLEITRTISADPFETKQFAKDFLAHTLLLAMLLRFTDSKYRLRALTYVVIATGMTIAGFGLLRFVAQPQQGGFLLHYLKGETGFGPFINRNHFSFLMEMTLGLISGLVIFAGLGPRKLRLFLACAITIWLATSLSDSRGGILALVCQIMLGFILAMSVSHARIARGYFRRVRRLAASSASLRAATLITILIIVVAGTVWVGGDQLKYRVSMVPTEIGGDLEENSVRRADIWKAGWLLFRAHPIAGSGFGGFSAAVTRYHEKAGNYSPHQAHNDYLEILASGGVIGVALGLWFVFGMYRFVVARLDTDSRFLQAARWGAIIGVFGVAIHSFVEFGLHVPGNSVVFMALLAISMADVRRKTRGSARMSKHRLTAL